VIEASARSLGGSLTVDYAADGLHFTMEAPARRVLQSDGSTGVAA
jgi:hypothetical protein